jgi:hypothetical protein
MRLWSIQRSVVVQRLTAEAFWRPGWPSDPAWARAYRWMAERVRERGVGEGGPPVWAWHSCGAWGEPPSEDTFGALLSEADRQQPHSIIELDAPDELVVLSCYGAWNQILDDLIDGREPPRRAVAALFDTRALDFANGDQVQANLPELRREWMVRSQQLPSLNP